MITFITFGLSVLLYLYLSQKVNNYTMRKRGRREYHSDEIIAERLRKSKPKIIEEILYLDHKKDES